MILIFLRFSNKTCKLNFDGKLFFFSSRMQIIALHTIEDFMGLLKLLDPILSILTWGDFNLWVFDICKHYGSSE